MLKYNDYCLFTVCKDLVEVGYDRDDMDCDSYFHVPSYETGKDCYMCPGIPRADRGSAFSRSNYVPRISLYEAQKWLREEKDVYVSVMPEYNEFSPVKGVVWRLEVVYWKDDEVGYVTVEWKDGDYCVACFDDYNEALLEGIKEAIKILKR